MVKTVLFTGASRGIGLEFARQYAQDGWRVHACCRQPGKAEDLKTALNGKNGLIHGLDVTDDASIQDLAQAIEDEAIDVLINNAGIMPDDRKADGAMDYEAWEAALRTNVIAPFRMVEALIDGVDAGDMRIIANISSLMGSIGDNRSGGDHIYRTTKTALNMVAVNLAVDLRERGITVLAFHPGWVRTDMGGSNAAVAPEDSVSGIRKQIAAAGPDQSGGYTNYDGTPLAW
jgi:NAD(P)-dependent dehydrogenase (short-subunit alcohol dehydrogenase family)